jgi:hypothetical protein
MHFRRVGLVFALTALLQAGCCCWPRCCHWGHHCCCNDNEALRSTTTAANLLRECAGPAGLEEAPVVQ